MPEGVYDTYATFRLGINPKSFIDSDTEEELIEDVLNIFWDAYGADRDEFKSVEISDKFIQEWKKLKNDQGKID